MRERARRRERERIRTRERARRREGTRGCEGEVWGRCSNRKPHSRADCRVMSFAFSGRFLFSWSKPSSRWGLVSAGASASGGRVQFISGETRVLRCRHRPLPLPLPGRPRLRPAAPASADQYPSGLAAPEGHHRTHHLVGRGIAQRAPPDRTHSRPGHKSQVQQAPSQESPCLQVHYLGCLSQRDTVEGRPPGKLGPAGGTGSGRVSC